MYYMHIGTCLTHNDTIIGKSPFRREAEKVTSSSVAVRRTPSSNIGSTIICALNYRVPINYNNKF